MTEAQLRTYMQAWADRDVDRILSLMTEDCVYHASSGPDLMGATFTGRDAVRAAVAGFFDAFPESSWVDVDLFVAGDRGYAEWTLRAVDTNDRHLETRGCDLFEFREGLVSVKNAFRKAQPAK